MELFCEWVEILAKIKIQHLKQKIYLKLNFSEIWFSTVVFDNYILNHFLSKRDVLFAIDNFSELKSLTNRAKIRSSLKFQLILCIYASKRYWGPILTQTPTIQRWMQYRTLCMIDCSIVQQAVLGLHFPACSREYQQSGTTVDLWGQGPSSVSRLWWQHPLSTSDHNSSL